MIIIVEGIDRVGKTTLCNALSESLSIPIYKHSQQVMDYLTMDNINETDKMLQLLDICKLINADIIFDRFHFSDFVYGIMERQYSESIAIHNLRLIDEILCRMNAVVIMVQPTDITASSREHGKDLTRYFKLMQKARVLSNVTLCACDYTTITQTVDYIKGIYHETI